MQQTVGIRFKQAGKIYYFSAGEYTLKEGDEVIAETQRGTECGTLVCIVPEGRELHLNTPLKTIQRKATQEDLIQIQKNHQKEKEAYKIALNKIKAHDLPMKLIKVECTFDLSKIIFYFTADGRVDFRELVKDLAAVFRTRIELRQIGVRDEAKLLGGIGICGRGLCCNTFLDDFIPVSIKMAKEQNLSLNPTKISGVCGRLMCCLKYENDCYCKNCPKKKVLPPHVGSTVVTTEGEGTVIKISDKEETATIKLLDKKIITASFEDIIEEENEEEIFTIKAIEQKNNEQEAKNFTRRKKNSPKELKIHKAPRFKKPRTTKEH